MLDRRAALSIGALLLACRAPSPPTEAAVAAPEPEPELPAVVFPRTHVREVTVLDEALLLVGQRRPSADEYATTAWIARVDLDGRIEWELELGDGFSWAEAALVDPLGPIHVLGRDFGGQAWLAQLDAGGRQLGLARLDLDEWIVAHELYEGSGPLDAELVFEQIEPSATPLDSDVLELAEPLLIEFGATTLALVQAPPSVRADARLLLLRTTNTELDSLLPTLTRAATQPLALPPQPLEERAWAWLWPFLPAAAELPPAVQPGLGAWLLAPDGCEPTIMDSACGESTLGYPEQPEYAPGDPCWQLAQVEEFVRTSSREAFVANYPALRELVLSAQIASRWGGNDDELEWTTPDTIITRAIEHGLGRELIRSLIFDADIASDAAFRGIAAIAELPDAEAIALARELLGELRDDYGRCDEVGLLARLLRERGVDPPRWRTDLESDCDILYMLCTGLDPDLEDRMFIGPTGYEIVETCAPSREHDEDGFFPNPCTPGTRRSHELEREIEPAEADGCGTNDRLLDLRYSCGVASEFERTEYLFDCSAGPCRLDRLEILHTAVD